MFKTWNLIVGVDGMFVNSCMDDASQCLIPAQNSSLLSVAEKRTQKAEEYFCCNLVCFYLICMQARQSIAGICKCTVHSYEKYDFFTLLEQHASTINFVAEDKQIGYLDRWLSSSEQFKETSEQNLKQNTTYKVLYLEEFLGVLFLFFCYVIFINVIKI